MSETNEMAQKESDSNAAARAAMNEAVNKSKQVDSMLFLREAPVSVYQGDSYFVDEHPSGSPRLYMLMRSNKQQILFMQYLEKIMVSGQVLITGVQLKTPYTVENFHQVFNGVTPLLQETDPERAKVMRDELITLCKAMHDYPVLSLTGEIYHAWDDAIKEKLAELRIPPTKNGAAFSSIDFLLGGVGGEFVTQNIQGAVFHYLPIDGVPQGPYLVMVSDFAPSEENNIENMQFNTRVFLSSIMQLMHQATGAVITRKLPEMVDRVLAGVNKNHD